jgi:hypothetical protein
MGNGGFLRVCVKNTGCRTALSYNMGIGQKRLDGCATERDGGMASICDRGRDVACVIGGCEAS